MVDAGDNGRTKTRETLSDRSNDSLIDTFIDSSNDISSDRVVKESLPSDVPVLRRAAMDYLARREHSYYELSQKLLGKFPDASGELIDEVLSRLRDQTLQSDERFTKAYIRYRKTKGFAYLHIKADLVQRKVPLPIINAYLYEDDADWNQIALTLVQKRLGEDGKLEFGSKLHRRLARLLESRGFNQLESRRVLAPVIER